MDARRRPLAAALATALVAGIACTQGNATPPVTPAASPAPSVVPDTCPVPAVVGGAATAFRTPGGRCIPPRSLAHYMCGDPAVPIIVRAGRRFIGGPFAVKVDTIPAETQEFGRSAGGISVLTVPGEPRWLFVRRKGQTQRWLPLPTRSISRNVLFIGDSIADGAEPALTTALSNWTATFDAVVGRPSIGGEAPAAAAASLRPGPDVVVVELGTNDADPAAFEANLRTIFTSLATVPLVVWQTVHSPQPAAIEVNAAGRRLAGTFPNVAIADWNAFVPPAALSSDGVHPLADHEGLMAKLVAPLLSTWAQAAAGAGPGACVNVPTAG